MRHFRIFLVAAVAVAAFLVVPAENIRATPSAGGPVFFSVDMIDPLHDISPGPGAAGETCGASDLLAPFPIAITACAPRVLPAPPGPVPSTTTTAAFDLGLDLVAGPFTDDLDAMSFSEFVGVTPIADYDFSVGPAPANGGTTVGIPGCPAPNVATEAAAMQAQGDYFTTLAAVGCNVQPATCGLGAVLPCDEATLGLIAPNPGAPGIPPLDDVDAMAEWPGLPGPCTIATGLTPTTCGAYSVAAGSPVLGVVPPDGITLLPPDAGTILAQPGTPPNLPNLPGGCPAPGPPCAAVHSTLLNLAPGDDIDALCWFDIDGDFVPDPPFTFFPGGDGYIFSLTPASPSVVGPYSAADLLTTGPIPGPAGLMIVRNHVSLGLAAGDNVDGLICHDLDGDGDLIPNALDTLDTDRDGFSDVFESGAPLCVGVLNDDSGDDPVTVNDGCPAVGIPEGACAGLLDDDFDGFINDGCPVVGLLSEGAYNIGTNPLAPCGPGAEPTPPGSAAWPTDLWSPGIPLSVDRISLTDFTSFLAFIPTRKFLTSPDVPPPPGLAYDMRWDLVPGPGALADWINLADLTAMLAAGAPSGAPPMFGGIRSFGTAVVCSGP